MTHFLRNMSFGVLFVISMANSTANAALMSVDAGFGANSGTLDTSTNLIWLDVDRTSGFAYAQIHGVPADYFGAGSPAEPGLFGSGKQFAGYRYATSAESTQLWNDSGVLGLDPTADEGKVFDIVNGLGIQNVDVTGTGSVLAYRAITGDADSSNGLSRVVNELLFERAGFGITPNLSLFSSAFVSDGLVLPNFNSDAGLRVAGSWLVRPAAVPLPGTIWLVAVGVLGMRFRHLATSGSRRTIKPRVEGVAHYTNFS